MRVQVTPEQYLSASPDPIAAFAGPVLGHMNADHMADTIAMISHTTGLQKISSAKLTGLDRLGMNAEVGAGVRSRARVYVRICGCV